MNPKASDESKADAYYHIDLDWFERANRSFETLARSRLCPASRESAEGSLGGETAADLLATFRDCCAQAEGFINISQPLLESLFRLFLANGNQPLSLEDIRQALLEKRRTSAIAPETLRRLLDGDSYYGLRPVAPGRA